MDYPLPHYCCDDHELLVETAKAFPLATLISIHDGGPLLTHLPLVYFPATAERAEHFVGHLDARNPQVSSIGDEMTAVFTGPSVYISPHDYERKVGYLPTYNFIRVHASGHTEHLEPPGRYKETLQSLVEMTEFLEPEKDPWQLSMDNKLAGHYLPHISAFRLYVEKWHGAFKLSQDKPKNERERTFQKLKKTEVQPETSLWNRLRADIF